MLETIYEQTSPVGYLGRGTHYSVMRALLWHDEDGTPFPGAQYNDFAVIWDEDHDVRVLAFIEEMQMHGLIAPLLFIGERKGVLSVITWGHSPVYQQKLEELLESDSVFAAIEDCWTTEVGTYLQVLTECPECLGIIADSPRSVRQYLGCIEMQWQLGIKTPEQVKSLIERLG